MARWDEGADSSHSRGHGILYIVLSWLFVNFDVDVAQLLNDSQVILCIIVNLTSWDQLSQDVQPQRMTVMEGEQSEPRCSVRERRPPRKLPYEELGKPLILALNVLIQKFASSAFPNFLLLSSGWKVLCMTRTGHDYTGHFVFIGTELFHCFLFHPVMFGFSRFQLCIEN